MNYDWNNATVICEKDGYRYLLGPESSVAMNWLSAIKWCQYVGGELPSRDVLSKCDENKELRKELADGWYWSSAELGATVAWVQSFISGHQYHTKKTGRLYARAIKRIPL